MPYFAPYLDADGPHFPEYQDIEDYLVESAKNIFGSEIYLGNDSQQFQEIAARAKTIYDTYQIASLVYDSRSPKTATGNALAAVVTINGITKKAASYSTVTVTITGTAFTTISNGVVGDAAGFLWDLPAEVVIGENGTVSVTATCQTLGAIAVNAGQINTIQTPVYGWTSVTNQAAGTPGQPIEADSQLRTRQAQSVANPSQALVDGILGSILAVNDVAAAVVIENDTGSILTDINDYHNPYGFPAHSITCVVDGGEIADIAAAINLRKTPGCYTNGDVTYVITENGLVNNTIRFFRPVLVPVTVKITIKALTGYTSILGDSAKQAVLNYINSLDIGQGIVLSELWQAILAVDPERRPRFSLTSVASAKWFTGVIPGTTDIGFDFDELAFSEMALIDLVVNT